MTETEWLDIFGDNLRDLMEECGYNQKQLAEATGLSRSSICDYIHKKKVPTIRAIVNICYELDCDMVDLVDFGDRIEV